MGYVRSNLEYFWSTLGYVKYVSSTLEYVGSAFTFVSFPSILMNIRSTILVYVWSAWHILSLRVFWCILGVLWSILGVLCGILVVL